MKRQRSIHGSGSSALTPESVSPAPVSDLLAADLLIADLRAEIARLTTDKKRLNALVTRKVKALAVQRYLMQRVREAVATLNAPLKPVGTTRPTQRTRNV